MAPGDHKVRSLTMFAACQPGMEQVLKAEMKELGLSHLAPVTGGVSFKGQLLELMRANLCLRTASRVLLRLAKFPAAHLSQLHKRAADLPWSDYVEPGIGLKVRATCKRSRIYHSGAAAQRVEQAILDKVEGVRLKAGQAKDEAVQEVLLRLTRDQAQISLDSSGALLHMRGHKLEVTGAPLRETLAAGLLRLCDYDGSTPLLDPMCGSGTFSLEGAALACGLAPGLMRSFAFERWPLLRSGEWPKFKARQQALVQETPGAPIWASDRSGGAVGVTGRNLARAGLSHAVTVQRLPLEQVRAPAGGPAGLLICNPPYGARMGRGESLDVLYAQIGKLARERLGAYRIAVLTSEPKLASACGLDFTRVDGPFAHGGLKVRLYQYMPRS